MYHFIVFRLLFYFVNLKVFSVHLQVYIQNEWQTEENIEEGGVAEKEGERLRWREGTS